MGLLCQVASQARQDVRRRGSAVEEQGAPTLLQPAPRRLHVAGQALVQLPEGGGMIHVDEMGHLVCDHIVEDQLRCKNQTPGEVEVAGGRAASPAAGSVPHSDPPERAGALGVQQAPLLARPGAQQFAGFISHAIGPATRKRFCSAATHKSTAITSYPSYTMG